jgi:hypothetical protein
MKVLKDVGVILRRDPAAGATESDCRLSWKFSSVI